MSASQDEGQWMVIGAIPGAIAILVAVIALVSGATGDWILVTGILGFLGMLGGALLLTTGGRTR